MPAEHREHLFRCPCGHFGGQHILDAGCRLCDGCPGFDWVLARCVMCGATPAEARPVPVSAASPSRNIVGRTYLKRGRPVVVLLGWGPGGGPRNVRVRREDGTTTVRPFRGLRRIGGAA